MIPENEDLISKEELITYLQSEIALHEGTAEECIQELDNPERADHYFGKIEALKEVVEYLNSKTR